MRVVNPSDSSVQVSRDQKPAVALSAQSLIASPFQVVDSRQPLNITVNGWPLKGLSVPKNVLVTLVLDNELAAAPRVIIEPQLRGKNLRAELNIYNLRPGCETADIKLANGASVFSQLPLKGQAQRTINPVQATLITSCEQSASLPLTLNRSRPVIATACSWSARARPHA